MCHGSTASFTWSEEREMGARPVFTAHRLVYHSTLGLRVIKKKKTGARSATGSYRLPGGGGYAYGIAFVY